MQFDRVRSSDHEKFPITTRTKYPNPDFLQSFEEFAEEHFWSGDAWLPVDGWKNTFETSDSFVCYACPDDYNDPKVYHLTHPRVDRVLKTCKLCALKLTNAGEAAITEELRKPKYKDDPIFVAYYERAWKAKVAVYNKIPALIYTFDDGSTLQIRPFADADGISDDGCMWAYRLHMPEVPCNTRREDVAYFRRTVIGQSHSLNNAINNGTEAWVFARLSIDHKHPKLFERFVREHNGEVSNELDMQDVFDGAGYVETFSPADAGSD